MKRRLGEGLLFAACLASVFCSQPAPPPAAPVTPPPPPSAGSIVEKDPALKAIASAEAKIEKLADGFIFTEGPIWVKEGGEGLLFSDIPNKVPQAERLHRPACAGGCVCRLEWFNSGQRRTPHYL